MFDDLQALFWSITYILVIVAGFKSQKFRRVSMPYLAGVLNFAWEFTALNLTRGSNFIHISWFGLDLLIVYIGYNFLKDKKGKILYLTTIFVLSILLRYLFNLNSGMLISVFVIDLIMAITYLFQFKQMSPYLKIPVAITKLIGDLFAGLYYYNELKLVAVIAVMVFICNSIYLLLCIREYVILGKKEYYNVKIEGGKVSSNCGKMNKIRRKK